MLTSNESKLLSKNGSDPIRICLINDVNIYGINVNYLTKNTLRSLMGIPIKRFIPFRVETV